jgi:hypothetical protein
MEESAPQSVFPAEAEASPNAFNRVTRFSKTVALSMLIVIPIIAFLFGMYYQSQIVGSPTNPLDYFLPK